MLNVRFHLKFCFILLLALTGCEKEAGVMPPVEPYQFFIAGHVSGNPANWHQGFHQPFKDKTYLVSQDSNLAFGILLGDMVKKGSAANFDAIDQDIAALEKPVYLVAGNHDVTDRPLFERRYGSSYYTFQKRGDLFIILDSNLTGWNISGNQLHFLESTLSENSRARNIYVLVHHLLWWNRENKFKKVRINSSTGRADSVNFYSEVLPLLRSHGAPVYFFAGDVGAQATGSEFMYYQERDMTFVATGMGGGERDNFIKIMVQPDGGVQFQLIAINGDDIHSLGKLEDYVLPD